MSHAPPRFLPVGSTARRRKNDKATDDRISRAYYGNCSGVQVSILDIPRIFAEGRRAIAEGADDVMLAARIVAFVDTIRCN